MGEEEEKLHVELGFFEDEDEDEAGELVMHEDGNWLRWDDGVAGGEPIWLHPFNKAEMESLIKCDKCGKATSFFLQVYAPLDGKEYESAFHRTIYVFVCRNPSCKAHCVVLRSQLARENRFYEFDCGSEDNEVECTFARNDGALPRVQFGPSFPTKRICTEREPGPDTSKCGLCGEPASARCKACNAIAYCSREHQRQDWKKHKPTCMLLREEMAKPVDEEDEKFTQEEFDELVAGDDKQLRQKLQRDANFEAFRERIARDPSQCIRYCRWPELSDTSAQAGPLWPSTKDKLQTPPNCKLCGASLCFEMQILPQSLHFLEDLETDFGSIFIYTCPKSCALSEGQYAAEYAYVQHLVAEVEQEGESVKEEAT